MSMRSRSRERYVGQHRRLALRADPSLIVSLEYAHQHPDPTSSDTPPSTPSEQDSHRRRPSAKRRTRPSTGTATGTGDEHDDDSRHHHHHRHRSSAGRFLTRMMERDDRDSKKMNTLLLLTTERLEGETTRANEMERKANDLMRRLRDTIHGRDLAVQETASIKEVGIVSELWISPRAHEYLLSIATGPVQKRARQSPT